MYSYIFVYNIQIGNINHICENNNVNEYIIFTLK